MQKKRLNAQTLIRVVISLVAVVCLVLHEQKIIDLPKDPFTSALLIIAALPWLSLVLTDIELPGNWKLKFRELEREVSETRVDVANLYSLSMSDDMYNNLVKLSKGEFKGYFLDPNGISGFAFELRYLKVIGYIAFDKNPNVSGVGNLPNGKQDHQNLSDYITVTEAGKKFITLREANLIAQE